MLAIDVNIEDDGISDCTVNSRRCLNASTGRKERFKELIVGYMMLEDAGQGDTLQRG